MNKIIALGLTAAALLAVSAIVLLKKRKEDDIEYEDRYDYDFDPCEDEGEAKDYSFNNNFFNDSFFNNDANNDANIHDGVDYEDIDAMLAAMNFDDDDMDGYSDADIKALQDEVNEALLRFEKSINKEVATDDKSSKDEYADDDAANDTDLAVQAEFLFTLDQMLLDENKLILQDDDPSNIAYKAADDALKGITVLPEDVMLYKIMLWAMPQKYITKTAVMKRFGIYSDELTSVLNKLSDMSFVNRYRNGQMHVVYHTINDLPEQIVDFLKLARLKEIASFVKE